MNLNFFWLVFSMLWCCLLNSQEALKRVDSAASSMMDVFGASDNILKVETIGNSEKELTLSIQYQGFTDKKYKIKAQVLNKLSKPMPEIQSVSMDLMKGANSIDITLVFKENSRAYQSTNLVSDFVLLNIYEAGGLLGGLSESFDDLTISGKSFKYKLSKNWRVKGSANMLVKAKLLPVGIAKNLK